LNVFVYNHLRGHANTYINSIFMLHHRSTVLHNYYGFPKDSSFAYGRRVSNLAAFLDISPALAPSFFPMSPHRYVSRRRFLSSSPAASSSVLLLPAYASTADSSAGKLPPAFSSLKALGDRVHPITPDEFHARILRAQELMAQANPKLEALLIGSGSS